jgi:ammonium transporter, Amt family
MAALVWMFLDCTDPEVARPSVLGTCTGAIAGLAAITPASGFVGPLGAFVIGTVSAIVCRFFATTVKTTYVCA